MVMEVGQQGQFDHDMRGPSLLPSVQRRQKVCRNMASQEIEIKLQGISS